MTMNEITDDEERRRYLRDWLEAGVVERENGHYAAEWQTTVATAFAQT